MKGRKWSSKYGSGGLYLQAWIINSASAIVYWQKSFESIARNGSILQHLAMFFCSIFVITLGVLMPAVSMIGMFTSVQMVRIRIQPIITLYLVCLAIKVIFDGDWRYNVVVFLSISVNCVAV